MSHAYDNASCMNKACKWGGIVRVVDYPEVGQGVYLRGPAMCECGQMMALLPKR